MDGGKPSTMKGRIYAYLQRLAGTGRTQTKVSEISEALDVDWDYTRQVVSGLRRDGHLRYVPQRRPYVELVPDVPAPFLGDGRGRSPGSIKALQAAPRTKSNVRASMATPRPVPGRRIMRLLRRR